MARRSIRLCGHEIAEPGHICAFFSSRDEEYETLIPYLQDGIGDGEHVVNVVDAARFEDHQHRLEAAGIPRDAPDLTVATSETTYLAGGSFDIDRMVGFVRSALERAAAAGQGVRTAGWMDWIHRDAPGTNQVMRYEAQMNLLTPTFDCTFMCIYDLPKLSGELMVDIMATHPYVVLRGQIRRNPFYVPPEIYLKEILETPRPLPRVTGSPPA
jgi:hypothetical protein